MKFIVVAGATGVGKTEFALNLAEKTASVLINFDSRQFFYDLKIGVNSLGLNFKENVCIENYFYPIYTLEGTDIFMTNFLSPNKIFNIFEFKESVYRLIKYLNNKNITPILVGGSGLYLDVIIKNYPIAKNETDIFFREKLLSKNLEELQEILKKNNFDVYINLNNSDKNNSRRLIRYIEKENLKGKYLEQFDKNSSTISHKFKMYYLKSEKNKLINNLNFRIEKMFEIGFEKEVLTLIEKYGKNCPALNTMGYLEVCNYLAGTISLNECKEKILRRHKKLVKKQITWFEGKERGYEFEIVIK